MILDIIEYLFFFISGKYKKWGDGSIAGVYAICAVTVLGMMNLVTLMLLALVVNLIKMENIPNFIFIILYFLFLLIIYLYVYKFKGSEKITEKFSEDKNLKIRNQALAYSVISILSFFVLFVYYMNS